MRILMLSWEYPPRIVGGIARVVDDLANKLNEEGNEVFVITCLGENSTEYENDNGVHVYRVPSYNIHCNNFTDWVMHLNFSMIEKAVELINLFGKFDIIHAHDWLVAYSAKTLKHSYKIPLISTIHATEHGRNNGIHNSIQKYINDVEWMLCYESWKVICNSNYMKAELKNIFNVPEDKVNVIPNGVKLNKFDGVMRDYDYRRNYARDNEKIVLYTGRIVREKGVHLIIEAMPKIIELYNDVKFIVVGTGAHLEQLKNYANSMGLGHKIYFTGFLTDETLFKIYKCADVAVFPSLYEPFGIVALEGMLAEIPVVVSDVGGLGEIINHDVDGMKFYVGNSNSLADSILNVLHDKEKAKHISRNGKEKVENIYNWNRISKLTSELYQQVVDEYSKTKWVVDEASENISRTVNKTIKQRKKTSTGAKKGVPVKEVLKKVVDKKIGEKSKEDSTVIAKSKKKQAKEDVISVDQIAPALG